jgi:hypothetical protein
MEMFSAVDKDRSKTMRARYDGALNANAALQNLLKRQGGKQDAMDLMGSENFHTVTTGERDFTRQDAEWVYLNGQGENYSLHDVSLSEDIFVRDEVSVEETFKVEGIPLRPYFFGGPKLRFTKTKVGLYQISSTMEEWAEDLVLRLTTERGRLGRPLKPREVAPIFMENPEWVNDDTGLIGKCHSDTANSRANQQVALISGDRKLANKMAETCNVSVMRIDPREFVRLATTLDRSIRQGMDLGFLRNHGIRQEFVYMDTGSVSAAAQPLEEEEGVVYTRQVRDSGWSHGHRYSQVTLTRLTQTRLRKELHTPVTRPKLWRSGSRPYESVYSSHGSWYEKRTARSSSSKSWIQDRQDLKARMP